MRERRRDPDDISAQIDLLCAVTRPHPATAGLTPIGGYRATAVTGGIHAARLGLQGMSEPSRTSGQLGLSGPAGNEVLAGSGPPVEVAEVDQDGEDAAADLAFFGEA